MVPVAPPTLAPAPSVAEIRAAYWREQAARRPAKPVVPPAPAVAGGLAGAVAAFNGRDGVAAADPRPPRAPRENPKNATQPLKRETPQVIQ